MKKKKTYTLSKYKDGGLPYGQIGALAGQLTTLAPDKEYGYGMSAPTIAEGAISKGLGLAGKGAALGNMIMPGLGTAIGAGLGFVGGAIAGGIGADKQQNQIEDAMSARKGNRTANPYGMVAEDGGMANTPMINIERGELEVDLATGDIVREFDKGYSKHSKNSKKEDPNNFVQAKPNTMIIPRKYAEEYKKNYKSRMGMIRDLANKQIDRELYGEDADGNKMEMSKLPEDVMMAKYGGVPMYYTGGIPPFNSIDLRPINNEFSNTFNNNPYPFPVEEPSMLAAEILPETNYGISGKYDNFLNMNLKDKMNYNPNSNKVITEVNKPETVDLEVTTNTDPLGTDSLWTTGNTVGAIGTGIGSIAPLVTTLARGIDRDERNPFMGVENAAVNELEGVFRRGKARTMDEVSRSFNAANDYLSNTRMSGASRLANMQGLASRRANALASAGTNYDLLQERTTSQMRLQGDSMEAQGLERMDDRLDRNEDNFYSNLNQDLVNLGQNTAFFGGMLNKQQGNEVRLNILKQISPYFDIDAAGNITFKGIPVSQEEIRRIEESVTR